MDNPLVSIIVSCYNHEKYIAECILSVVNQTYQNIELIVIDDGSSDNSPEILRELRDKYGFFLEIQENIGLSKTLNKAIRNYAHGKYIAGCGSDDFLALDRIEKQVRYMEAHPEYAMVFGEVYVVDSNSEIIEDLRIIDPVVDPVKSLQFESLVESNPIPAMTVILRKDVWEECGGYNENTIVEDLDMWLKIAYNYKIGYMNEYLAYYRWQGANITLHTVRMCKAVWDILLSWENKVSPAFARKMLTRRSAYYFNILARLQKKESFKYLKWSLSYFYFDSYVLTNYLKGLGKFLFYWKKNYQAWV
ncbi:MAG: glycosyltransferase [Dysgonamonadaceae bacterium]|jgi:alpha-1,3-rhamnosyltransferase|nr:glycosyltransferase [Dysgonamonadaceae bacterium]